MSLTSTSSRLTTSPGWTRGAPMPAQTAKRASRRAIPFRWASRRPKRSSPSSTSPRVSRSVACCLPWVYATWARAWARSSPNDSCRLTNLSWRAKRTSPSARASVPRSRRASSSSWPCPKTLPCWSACVRRACRSRSTWAPRTRKPQPTLAWRASSPTHSRLRV